MSFLRIFGASSIIQVVVFGAFLMGLYYFSFYNDGSSWIKEIQNIKNQAQTVQTNIKKAQMEINEARVVKEEIEKNARIVEALLKFTPGTLHFNQINAILTRQAKLTGVNIESKKDANVEDVPDSEYQTLSVELKLTSSFPQLMTFLASLTQQKLILIVKSINVNINQNTSGVIESQLKLIAYRYIPPKPESKEEEVI